MLWCLQTRISLISNSGNLHLWRKYTGSAPKSIFLESPIFEKGLKQSGSIFYKYDRTNIIYIFGISIDLGIRIFLVIFKSNRLLPKNWKVFAQNSYNNVRNVIYSVENNPSMYCEMNACLTSLCCFSSRISLLLSSLIATTTYITS